MNSHDGSQRLHEGTTTQVKTFLGEYSDPSGLSYLNARYYSPVQGRFISQDEVFLIFGTEEVKNMTIFLLDPQLHNSYSYGRDNPIVLQDKSGKCIEDICIVEGAMALAVMMPAIISMVNSPEALFVSSVSDGIDSISSAKTFGQKVLGIGMLGLNFIPDGAGLAGAAKAGARKALPFYGKVADGAGGYVLGAGKDVYNVTAGRVGHIFSRHEFGNGISNVSNFLAGMGREEIIDVLTEGLAKTTNTGWISNGREYYQQVVDMGRIIGTDVDGQASQLLMIVKDAANKIITTFTP